MYLLKDHIYNRSEHVTFDQLIRRQWQQHPPPFSRRHRPVHPPDWFDARYKVLSSLCTCGRPHNNYNPANAYGPNLSDDELDDEVRAHAAESQREMFGSEDEDEEMAGEDVPDLMEVES